MNERNRFTTIVERVLNRHSYEALGPRYGDRLDPNAGIDPHLLLPALQHIFVEEFDQAGGVGSTLFPFDPGINVFGVLAEDDNIHALGMFHRGWHALVVLDRTHAGVEIENLVQRDVQRTNTASHRSSQRPFDGNAKFSDGSDRVIGKPVFKASLCLLAGKNFVPRHASFARIGFFYRRVKYPDRRFPDVATCAVSFNEGHDGMIGHGVLAVAVSDRLPMDWNWNAVKRCHDQRPPRGTL